MNIAAKRQLLLTILLTTCIISTAIHLTDNSLYIEQYPQPDWMTQNSIDLSWIGLKIVGLVGYGLYRSGQFWRADFCLVLYSFSGIDSLLHYCFGSLSDFSFKMNFFILTDGLTGLAIFGFTLWSALILKKQYKESVIE